MANYPALAIDNESEKNPVEVTDVSYTAGGNVRIRNFQSAELFEFNITHSYVTQAEAESVYTSWSTYKNSTVTLTWKDSTTYDVYYRSPPRIELMRGQWWRVETELAGSETP